MQKEINYLNTEVYQIEKGLKQLPIPPDQTILEQMFLSSAKIVFTTLSTGGNNRLRDSCKDKISYLIVDEACQCIEPSCLIPFTWDPAKVILVGDHKQLPATTFSENSIETNFSRSLFERMLQGGI